MLECIHSRYLPRKTVLLLDADQQADGRSFLRDRRRTLDAFTRVDGKTTAYVCDNFACSSPVVCVEELEKLLDFQGNSEQ